MNFTRFEEGEFGFVGSIERTGVTRNDGRGGPPAYCKYYSEFRVCRGSQRGGEEHSVRTTDASYWHGEDDRLTACFG